MERTGFRPLYAAPALYLAALYLCPVFVSALGQGSGQATESPSPIFKMTMLLLLVLALANIVAAVVGYRREPRAFLLNSAVLLKYGLIPLYLVGGTLVVFISSLALTPVPGMLFVGPLGAFLLSACGWLIMVPGSVYAIAYVLAARRDGTWPAVPSLVNVPLQFFFVADVVDVMALSWRAGRWRIPTALLAVAIALIAVALVLGGVGLVAAIASTVTSSVTSSAAAAIA